MTFSSSLKKWWKATKCSSQAPVKRAERDWSDKSDGNTDSRESSSMDVMCSSTEVSGTNNPVPTSGPPAAGQDSQEQQHKQEQQSQQRQQQQQQQQQQQGNSQQGTGQQQVRAVCIRQTNHPKPREGIVEHAQYLVPFRN
eukprot:1147992-Pelagomonas_calceolata.AAC.16